MTVGQLREKFEETWGEPTNTRNKQWLVKRIAWKMQATSKATFHSGPGVAPLNSLAAPTSVRLPPKPSSRPEVDGRHRDGIRPARRRQSSPAAEIRDRASLQRRENRGARFGERLRVRGGDLQNAQRCGQEDHGQHCNGYHFFKLNKKGGDK